MGAVLTGRRKASWARRAAIGIEGGDLFAENLGGTVLNVPGRLGGGGAKLFAELTDLGEVAGEQAGDLRFERAGIDDLAERGIRGKRQKVASDVEGAGLEGALVGLGLHGLGLRDSGLERGEHAGADLVVGDERGAPTAAVNLGVSEPSAGVNQPERRKF